MKDLKNWVAISMSFGFMIGFALSKFNLGEGIDLLILTVVVLFHFFHSWKITK